MNLIKLFINKAEEDIVHDWSHDDVVTLFNNIEAQLPQTDTIKSDRRLDQIDWELIKFKNFLPEECKDYAKSFIQKVFYIHIINNFLVFIMFIYFFSDT